MSCVLATGAAGVAYPFMAAGRAPAAAAGLLGALFLTLMLMRLGTPTPPAAGFCEAIAWLPAALLPPP